MIFILSIQIPSSKSQPNLNNKNIQIKNNNEPLKKRMMCMHEFSKTGYSGEDEKKVNQDNYFVFTNFCNKYENMFLGVW